MDNQIISQIMSIYDKLSPENQDRFFGLIEEAAHIQAISSDSQSKEQ